MRAKIPVISVDTKKKELVGAFHNKGRRWGKKKGERGQNYFPLDGGRFSG
jgi:hypothetical protein